MRVSDRRGACRSLLAVHGHVCPGNELAERFCAVWCCDGIADAETEWKASLELRVAQSGDGTQAIDDGVECQFVELAGNGKFIAADAADDVVFAKSVGEELGGLSERR